MVRYQIKSKNHYYNNRDNYSNMKKREVDKIYLELPFFNIVAILHLLLFFSIALLFYLGYEKIGILLIFLSLTADFLILYKCIQMFYRAFYRRRFDYPQVESLFSIYSNLKPRIPYPPMRGYAGSPDFLNAILYQLITRQPKFIVEASSGVSSMVIADWIKTYSPETKHIALEHESKYASLTQSRIDNPTTKIVLAPLKNYDLDGTTFKWYDLNGVFDHSDLEIDMLIIDGPPAHTNHLARYPALPLLEQKFSRNCITILDDGQRDDEKEIVDLWKKKFNLDVEHLGFLEKEAYILKYNS